MHGRNILSKGVRRVDNPTSGADEPPTSMVSGSGTDPRESSKMRRLVRLELSMRTNRPSVRLGVVLLVLTMGAGCMKVGPNYLRPASKVSQEWIEVSDKRVSKESKEDREWWKVFNDPVLERLMSTAYSANLSLQIAGVRVLQARAQLGIAIGNQFPQMQQLTGALAYNRISEHSPNLVQPVPAGTEFSYNQSTVGFQASWEIDFWGKFRRAIESADANLLASIANFDNAIVTLTADVATSYIQIRTLEERIRIAKENVVIETESLNIADARFKGGTTTQRDVEQAKTVLASTQATIPQLEYQLQQAKNGLCVLLGMPPKDLTELLGENKGLPSPSPEVAVGIPADLLARRPDIRAADAQAAAQCAQIGVAKADLFPSLSILGNIGLLSSDKGSFTLGNMFDAASGVGTIGPSLQWNIFNYGQITNNVRLQDAKFQEAVITYQNTVLNAQKDVENSLIAFLRIQEQAKFLTESSDAATRSLDLAVLQYRQGIADFTTVLTAQQALLQQQDNLEVALGNISINLIGVYRALGGGWEMRDNKEFVPAPMRKVMADRTNWGNLLNPDGLVPPGPEERGAIIRKPDW